MECQLGNSSQTQVGATAAFLHVISDITQQEILKNPLFNLNDLQNKNPVDRSTSVAQTNRKRCIVEEVIDRSTLFDAFRPQVSQRLT